MATYARKLVSESLYTMTDGSVQTEQKKDVKKEAEPIYLPLFVK